MKTLLKLSVALTASAFGFCFSPAALGASSSDLTIIQTMTPQVCPAIGEVLPEHGQVCVAINIDATGHLADYLVLSYSNRRFAEAAVEALRQWEFRAPCRNGEPLDVLTTVTFDFEMQGQVVSLSGSDVREAYMQETFGSGPVRCVFPAKAVDSAPQVTRVVSPVGVVASDKAAAWVKVTFFIDETGRPRMATVDSTDDALLAAAALRAIEQWRFTPARRDGVPVAVKATQQFKFPLNVASN